MITGKYSKLGDPRIGELMYLDDPSAKNDSKGSEKLNKIVVLTREVEYKHWDREAEEEWFSHGTEIVREVDASDAGLALWTGWSADQRAEFVKGLR